MFTYHSVDTRRIYNADIAQKIGRIKLLHSFFVQLVLPALLSIAYLRNFCCGWSDAFCEHRRAQQGINQGGFT